MSNFLQCYFFYCMVGGVDEAFPVSGKKVIAVIGLGRSLVYQCL